MEGVIKTYDPKTFAGTVHDANGKSYLVRRDSFRRGAKLAEGMAVNFSFSNLSAGATAQNVQPITQKSQQ
jgi:cold shock CspA family protein